MNTELQKLIKQYEAKIQKSKDAEDEITKQKRALRDSGVDVTTSKKYNKLLEKQYKLIVSRKEYIEIVNKLKQE